MLPKICYKLLVKLMVLKFLLYHSQKLYTRSNSNEQLIASEQVSRSQSGTSRERLVPSPDSRGIRFVERHTSRQVVNVDEVSVIHTAKEQLR